MTTKARLRSLDERVLRDRPSARREAWGRRHGWSLFALLGALLSAFGAWAFAADRPAMALLPFAFGIGWLALGALLFAKRPRE